VEEICKSPIPKMAQNGLFDIQYLAKYAIAVMNYRFDTMLAHHAIQPEMRKNLGFMGSLYTNEVSWKILRTRRKVLRTELKAGDE